MMEFDAQQNFRDDRTSDCRSFGSNYHLSSQSRKISIGVMVDSLARKNSETTKEDDVALPNAKRVNSYVENSKEAKNKGGGIAASVRGKRSEAPKQLISPWLSTRSFYQKIPTSETVLRAKQASSVPAAGASQNKLNGVKDAPVTYSVQFFANQTSVLQSGNSKQKKFDGISYNQKRAMDRNSETVEEFTFATAQEVLVSNKGMMGDKTENRRTETLKMKLWEILGTVSSPKSQYSNAQAPEVGASNSNLEQIGDQKGDTVVKPRQNSDTIETDSESPADTMRRPVTRSLTRKRAPTKVQPSKTKGGQSSSYRQKHQEGNIFTFEEGWSRKQDGPVDCNPTVSMRKKSQRKSSSIKPRKICFPEKDNANKIQQATCGSKTPPAEKTSSIGSKMGGFLGFPPENGRDYFEPMNKIQEKDWRQSPMKHKINQKGDFDSPTLPDNGDQQGDFGNSSLKNVVDPQDDFQSPTFGIKTPILSPSPSLTPTTVPMEQDVISPTLAERRFTEGNIRDFRTLQTSKSDGYGSNVQSESSDDEEKLKDDEEKLKDSSPRKPMAAKGKKDAEDENSEYSSEERDSESSEEGSPIFKGYDCHRERETSTETGTAEKPKFIPCPAKRLRNHEGVRVNEFSPTLSSPKGIGESEGFQDPSEQNQEDELTRAVTLFALALEHFKRKMQTVTRKKSSEILVSVSEGIQLQLQNVESQIQTDVGKLTSLSKSKRKRLETRFQDQREKLKFIHNKFKEDIQSHLQDCRSTLEGLEAHHIEFKGTLKKQKVSHQKLLLQVEEVVETQFNDAQKRITTVHELAQEKMLQLKHVIAECLKDGILN